MKNISRQFLFFVLFSLFWYGTLIALSYLLYPDTNNIDSIKDEKTVYYNTYTYMVSDMPRFAMSGKKEIFLIGSSNVREGFRPEELRVLFPEFRIHNLGSGASNITQAKDYIDLITLLFSKDVIKDSVFIFGIWYGNFVDDKTRWKGKPTNVGEAEIRSGLYRINDGKIFPSVKKEFLPYLVTLLRPCFALTAPSYKLQKIKEDTKTFAHELVRKRKIDFSVYIHKDIDPKVDDAYKRYALKFWDDYMNSEDGLLKQEQFEKLLSLCRFVAKSGATVVIVDLPLPKWHSNYSTYYADYQQKKSFYIREALMLANVKYIDMQDSMEDADFVDSAHPSRVITKKWSIALKKGFNKLGLAY